MNHADMILNSWQVLDKKKYLQEGLSSLSNFGSLYSISTIYDFQSCFCPKMSKYQLCVTFSHLFDACLSRIV